MNPEAVVVATGCYVQAAKEDLKVDESIDLIIGNNQKGQLVALLEEYEKNHAHNESVIDIAHTNEYESMRISHTGEHTRAFIKVQDGCNQFCSYCIIPYARGRVRSRKLEDVLSEVTELAVNGYREIVLTGIHLSSYGVDFTDDEENLQSLILKLSEVEGIERIRLGSLEPRIITEEFVSAIASCKKICPHFHLSLQSGCEATLKRMNRHYTPEEYLAGCEIIRKYFEHPAITTDVIVGFPGETEEEFEETKTFLRQVQFYEMHIFKYSKRKGTRAAVMPNQVPEEIKTKRSHELMELEAEMSHEFREYYLGKNVEVLTEEWIKIGDKKFLTGYTKEYVKCLFSAGEENVFQEGIGSEFLSGDALLLKE